MAGQLIDRYYESFNEQQFDRIEEIFELPGGGKSDANGKKVEQLMTMRSALGEYTSREQTSWSSGSYVGSDGQWSNVSVTYLVMYEPGRTTERFSIRVEEGQVPVINEHVLENRGSLYH